MGDYEGKEKKRVLGTLEGPTLKMTSNIGKKQEPERMLLGQCLGKR